jgi:DNA-3-methyladenine glycosylase II
MATRRSSRLSAANGITLKNEAVASVQAEPVKKSRKRKGEELKDASPSSKPTGPATPKRKAARHVSPPIPSTPAGVNDMARASRPLEIRDRTPEPPVNRLADPFTTNAALISPESSKLFNAKAVADASPSKPSKLRLTTLNILQQALDHLVEIEPKLKPIVEKHHCQVFSPEGLAEVIDPFVSLTSSIIGQQVGNSVKRSHLNV